MSVNNMNELQFRKAILSDPFTEDLAVQAYFSEHKQAQDFVVKMRQFDRTIEQVLDVSVPEGLQERILLKQTLNQNNIEAKNDATWWPKLSALVASVAIIALVLTVGLHKKSAQIEPLALENSVLKHILEHGSRAPNILLAQKTPQSKQQLQRLFAQVGATLNQPVDFMSYAGPCTVARQKGLHIVVQEIAGPVNIVVLPGKRLLAMTSFEKNGLMGEMIPVQGGVVAIVGKNPQQLAMAQMQFFKAVKFG